MNSRAMSFHKLYDGLNLHLHFAPRCFLILAVKLSSFITISSIPASVMITNGTAVVRNKDWTMSANHNNLVKNSA